MTRKEALAYFTPHPLTKGPVMLAPEKMREAAAVLQGGIFEASGIEITEAICPDKLKRENAELREALKPFAEYAEGLENCDDLDAYDGVLVAHLKAARTLLSQSSEGGETK